MKEYLMKKYALSQQGSKDFIKGCIATAVQNLVCMVPVGLLYLVIADMMEGKAVREDLPLLLGGCLLSLLLLLVVGWFQYETTYMATYKESGVRRISIAEKLRRVPLSYFGTRDLSDLSETMMSDCQALEVGFSHNMPTLVGSAISTLLMGLGLFVLDWRMGLAAFWVIPVSLLMILLAKKVQYRLNRKTMEEKLAYTEGLQEYLESLRDLRECGAQGRYQEGLQQKIDAAGRAAFRSQYGMTAYSMLAGIVLKFGIVSVAITGVSLWGKGQLSPLLLILYLILAARFYDPLQGVLQNIVAIQALQVNIDRMNEVLAYPVQEGRQSLNHQGYDMVFDHVGFSYDGEEEVLTDVSFQAKQGEVTALVGPSGGGKTTISRLAARFWDIDRGRITVGGMDISQVAPEELMSLYSMVFQDVMLFDDSIFENIRIGKKEASEEEVLRAARLANCQEIAAKFPEGWQTRIGENGARLSGGERQRISIARAFLKDAPIILLDEATASLDVENENQIQAAISRLIQNKTVLVIAHRMRTITQADQIVLLKDGRVAETGKPQSLLDRDSMFAAMAQIQGLRKAERGGME